MIPKLRWVGAIILATEVVSLAISAQKPNEKLLAARALYYTPTAQGLKSFHCDVIVDWKDLLTRVGGTEINDDNPLLKYLQTVHLSATDDLRTGGGLEWANTATPPEGKEQAATQMSGGIKQMFNGFFQSWNGYMNGTMVPAPDSSTVVTEADGGLHLYEKTATAELNESFDKNFLLTDAHVVMPTLDATAYPSYEDTPDGRIVSVIRTVYRQPPSAPPAELTMKIGYAPVSNFRLPETLQYELKNVGLFVFKLSGCTVQTNEKAAEKR
ncbi:MAG TPA: hypothetical protein VGM11_07920 [Acidobacteriaceae bacterium]|jgi:hypothetical protein